MNVAELQPLKTLSLPIVVPKKVPDALTLQNVVPLPAEDESGDGYRIEWKSSSASLTLLAASGGIGDRVPGQESVVFRSPTFGECSLEVDDEELVTHWMSEMESGLPAYSLEAKGLAREQFLEVAQSLDYIKVR